MDDAVWLNRIILMRAMRVMRKVVRLARRWRAVCPSDEIRFDLSPATVAATAVILDLRSEDS